jgi:hypothetical protein
MTLARPAIAFCALVALAWLWRYLRPSHSRRIGWDEPEDGYERWMFV